MVSSYGFGTAQVTHCEKSAAFIYPMLNAAAVRTEAEKEATRQLVAKRKAAKQAAAEAAAQQVGGEPPVVLR